MGTDLSHDLHRYYNCLNPSHVGPKHGLNFICDSDFEDRVAAIRAMGRGCCQSRGSRTSLNGARAMCFRLWRARTHTTACPIRSSVHGHYYIINHLYLHTSWQGKLNVEHTPGFQLGIHSDKCFHIKRINIHTKTLMILWISQQTDKLTALFTSQIHNNIKNNNAKSMIKHFLTFRNRSKQTTLFSEKTSNMPRTQPSTLLSLNPVNNLLWKCLEQLFIKLLVSFFFPLFVKNYVHTGLTIL